MNPVSTAPRTSTATPETGGTTGRRESTEDRRIAIAFAARALIVEKGFEGLRTRDIADRVGINVATLHYHVPSREALITLVTETLKRDFVALHLSTPRQGLTAAEELALELKNHGTSYFEDPELLLVMSELSIRARRDETVRAIVEPLRQNWRKRIAAILARGKEDGSFRNDLDPVSGARLITGALAAFRGIAAPKRQDFDALCQEFMRSVRRPR
ncbi:TetR/AcrR family transcriptional regulator [Mariluticola halotolerans]|uniref:TetR/AcrR family transcriptional regulator n=1 Tax=Mariluticola halotolerans TaxID=2909283 RepID=UPI0026E31F92|nr:TetR/AcrR family transcriptional regulator [Mariluticola halotolerans]UJQ93135.1 TetR/AcrR family transcriptional regulator [Mariluticola halotolerans]